MRLLISLAMATILLLPPATLADEWNRATTAIFNHPVEVPGQILPAGIYVFRLAEISGERNVVQIWNAEQTLLVATVFAWPDYLRDAPEENRFVLEEGKRGAPARLTAWFYKGNNHAQTFIYRKR
jgi:hypothetical protein